MSGFCECQRDDGEMVTTWEVSCQHAPSACRVECNKLGIKNFPKSSQGTPSSPPPPPPPPPSPPPSPTKTTAGVDAYGRAAKQTEPRTQQPPQTEQQYRCVGWVATQDCDPAGPRDQSAQKRDCSDAVPAGASGYCQCEGLADGVKRKVRLATCDHAPITCAAECERAGSHYSCQGWRQTGNCSADGPREEARDLPCEASVAAGISGFCECGAGASTRRMPRRTGCKVEDEAAESCDEVCRRDESMYEVLGLPSGTGSDQEIKQTFRRLSLRLHPDKNRGSKQSAAAAATRFAEVRAAYDLLSSPDSRILYDMHGFEAASSTSNKQRGGDSHVSLTVSLADAYLGGMRDMRIRRRVVCKGCKHRRLDAGWTRCHRCGSCPNELRNVNVQLAPGFVIQQQQEVASEERCEEAHLDLKAPIPRGVGSGHEITYSRASEQRPGMIPGDVKLKFKVDSHPLFQRDGNELHMGHTVSLREALLGFEHHIMHLDGRTVVLTQSGVTKPGQVIKIRGEGMPIHEKGADPDAEPSQFGSMHVKITVRFPKSLTEEGAEWARKVLPA